MFAYGDKLYNPKGIDIGPELAAHETVHGIRQGADPETWWRRYCADVAFRYDEELVAHRAEWKAYAGKGTRIYRRLVLNSLDERLASPLYGSIVTVARAKMEIRV